MCVGLCACEWMSDVVADKILEYPSMIAHDKHPETKPCTMHSSLTDHLLRVDGVVVVLVKGSRQVKEDSVD